MTERRASDPETFMEKDERLDGLLRAARTPEAEGLAQVIARELVKANLGLGDRPTVGRHRIEGKVGEGGMGTVFRAHDPELDRPVAIKVLHPQVDEVASGMLAREARALARLSHPNVLVVHDVGTRDHQLWLAMEFVAGDTLRGWRMDHPEIPWREIVRLFIAAGRGLAAAHEAGVVHRDFKPDNVMVGADGRVRVADFGLALIDLPAPTPGAEPSQAPLAGTPLYLPPEVLRGEPPAPAGDQYSFFVSLRETLAPVGTTPPEALPAELEAMIVRGLASEPAQRFGSMQEVVTRLEAIVSGPPEDPKRRVLLDRVAQIWLDGVLTSALDGRPAVPLRVRDARELVEPPWDDVTSDAPSPEVPLGVRSTASLRTELVRAHGALLIVGPPGAGKTTALLGLGRTLLERARLDASEPAPVVLNLASLSTHRGTFDDWLVDELVTKYGLPRRRAQSWIEDDQLVLLLDGLDEVAVNRRRAVVAAIDTFRRVHPVRCVVACREDNFVALGVRIGFGAALRIEPPDDEGLQSLCRAHGAAGQAALAALTTSVQADGAAPTPLVVALYLRTATPDATAGARDHGWSGVIERALDRPPPLPTRQRSRLVGLLGWVARSLQRTSGGDIWLERMQVDWLERPGARLAARALGVFGMMALLVAINLVANALAHRPPVVALILGLASVPVALLFNRGLDIHAAEALRWSWRRSVRRMPLVVALALGVGVVFGAIYVLWVNIVLSLTVALVVTLVVGLEPRDREDRLRPGQGLWRALQHGLVVGPLAGVLAGVAVGFIAVPLILPLVGPESQFHTMIDPEWSLFWTTAIFVFGLVAFTYGWTAVVLHLALRLVLRLTAGVPLRLTPWLDKAADRGLLRKVGGGWMFQHRTLLDHIARLVSKDDLTA